MPETASARAATGADLRQAILDATRHLLVADGYPNLSMRKIAGAVGCSATSIYLHFAGKDALVHALIGEGMEALYRALQTADPAGDPIQRLDALSRAYVDFGLSNPELYEVMFQLHPARMERFPVDEYRRARRNLDLFESVLASGAEVGVLDATPTPEVAAHALWTALHGLVSLRLAERVDVRLAADAFTDAAVGRAVRAFRVSA
ncbi:MAG: TetR/AcrR family transcriptional regulator [Bacteroidota bacterium]